MMAFRLAFLLCFAAAPSVAEERKADIKGDVSLDIDGDGRADRAALVANPQSGASDLYIFLGAGEEKLDLSRAPSFIKRNIASRVVQQLSAKDRSLLVEDATGGASNDYDDTLTIVYRNGSFQVAGYAREWDTRTGGVGACEVNFLTGAARVSHGVNGAFRPAPGRFRPSKLIDWPSSPLRICQ